MSYSGKVRSLSHQDAIIMATSGYNRLENWIKRLFRRILKRSWGVHASIEVTELPRAVEFYRQLGFRPVTASRGKEVTLLRSSSGAELNLVHKGADSARTSNVALALPDLDKAVHDLKKCSIDIDSGPNTGPNNRWLQFKDPDGNVIEFYQVPTTRERSQRTLFHIATKNELVDGISEFYYSPPEDKGRFLYCETGSTIVLLAAANVYKRLGLDLFLVKLDKTRVSLMPGIGFDTDIDMEDKDENISSYPDVYKPVARDAITGATPLILEGEAFRWPAHFEGLDSVLV